MEHSIRVQAIVLRHNNYGEADRFITLLTSERGKITALAKGVRKVNSRKAGHLEPFTYVNVQINKGRAPYWLIDQVTAIEAFPSITDCLSKVVQASYACELIDRLSFEDSQDNGMFQLLLDTIRRISQFEDIYPALRYFDLHILSIAGYQPQLRQCSRCHKPTEPENQFFSYETGGVLCPQCGTGNHSARHISMRTLKFFRHYQSHSYREASSAGWPAELREESESILSGYFSHILERKINSKDFGEKNLLTRDTFTA